ncbi:MAG: hypothetical protein Q9164_000766 [Protoblastenia rupestris]
MAFSDLSTLPLNLELTDTNGNDVAHMVTIHNGQVPPLPISKRTRIQYSRRMEDCSMPDGYPTVFLGSRCLPNINPQAFEVECARAISNYPSHFYNRSCLPMEICVDETLFNVAFRAWCVGADYFVRIAGDHATKERKMKKYQPTEDSPDLVGIVVTGTNIKDQITAAHLKIGAYKGAGIFNGVAAMGELPNGTNSCDQCSMIGLDPVPAGTQQFRASVKFNAAGFKGARIYWATIRTGK